MSCKILSNKNNTERAEDAEHWEGTCLACVMSVVQIPSLNEKNKKEEEGKKKEEEKKKY